MRSNQQQPQSASYQQSQTIIEKKVVHPVAPQSDENRQGRSMQAPTPLKQEPQHRGGDDRQGGASTPQQTTHQKGEEHRQNSKLGEIKQKKVWKVTTPEK